MTESLIIFQIAIAVITASWVGSNIIKANKAGTEDSTIKESIRAGGEEGFPRFCAQTFQT